MGTRAVYFFEDQAGVFGVYKHYDNHPAGAACFIEDAKDYAWPLPRFEADEFAGAFVSANNNPSRPKGDKGGEMRLLPMFEHTSIDMVMDDHVWCDYYYVIKYDMDMRDLHVTIFRSEYDEGVQRWEQIASMPHQTMLRAYAYGEAS